VGRCWPAWPGVAILSYAIAHGHSGGGGVAVVKVVSCRRPHAKLRSVEIVLRCDAGFLENMGTLLHNRRRTRGLPLWADVGLATACAAAFVWAMGLLG